jgi:O-antigen/teichoic acid export membrane protein
MNTIQSGPRPLSMAKNTLYNLVGYGAPLIVAAFSIPLIIKGIGTDRFGILTLAWVVIGYLSLLDLGTGRALTKVVSEKIGRGQLQDIPATIWTALSAMLVLSVFIGLAFAFSSHKIVYVLIRIPLELRHETHIAFLMLAAVIPVIFFSVGFRGVLEAYQRFDLVNAVRIPLGIFSFVAPLMVIPFSASLTAIIGVLIAGRVVAASIQFLFCCKVEKNLLHKFAIDAKTMGRLLRFGGWMTVSNVVAPILVYIDRFLIGAFLSVSVVAYYSTPSEVITKVVLISAALMSVLFPAISATFAVDRRRSAFLLDSGIKYIFIIIYPIVLTIVSFAPEALEFWLNDTFANQSTRVTQILAVGILFICLERIPYAFIQGAGRPDYTGILHLTELPIYLFLAIGSLKMGGIDGVAMVWTLRAIFDAGCMLLLAQHMLGTQRIQVKTKLTVICFSLLPLAVLAITGPIAYRLFCYLLTVSLFIFISIHFFLSDRDKEFFRSCLAKKKILQ